MRAKRLLAALSLALVTSAGCTDPGQPSPPPEPVDSLSDNTTTSSEPPAPDTDTETATATASPSTEAGGAPELPAAAKEQSEAGAEAFVAHYFDLLNYGTVTPAAEALEDTAVPDCQTCVAFQQSLDILAENNWHSDGPSVELLSASAIETDAGVSVDSKIAQVNPAVLTAEGEIETSSRQPIDVLFTFRLVWTEAGWRVEEVD